MLKPEHIMIPLNREEEIETPKTLKELKLKKKDLRTRSIEDIEKSFLIAALKRNDWNITRAAAEVGMQRTNFHGLLKKYNISKGKGE
jgi:transcriptional regulator of acetoin/glycerol metabolism